MTGLIIDWEGRRPDIDATAFIAPNATVIGDTVIGPDTSVWFNVVLRGDMNTIRVGARTNIQDGTIVHVSESAGAFIGDDVTIGHTAIVHACRLEAGCFVGMGAIVLDEAVVEAGAMVAAGALVSPGKRVPAGELWAGRPARKLRDIGPADLENFAAVGRIYADYGRRYRLLAARPAPAE